MKICFWGDNAGAFNGNPLGGGELQLALLSKALVKAGNEVVFVDYNVKDNFITEDGIKVFCVNGYDKGIKALRTLTRRPRLIYKSLKDQKADIYYCRIRDFRHILAFWASRNVKAKFILGLASDIDVEATGKRLKYLYLADAGGLWWLINGIMSEIVYFWLLRKSDLVIVQHSGQKEKLLRKGIESKVLYNLIDLNKIPVVPEPVRQDFCYVGSLDKRKGFVDFFEIMKRSPYFSFNIIGSPRDKTGFRYYEKSKKLVNAKLSGRLSHKETLYQMTNAKALISTSPMEGFPNIFLEAWACGVPVLSLYFDPGNIIENEGLGFVAGGDINQMLKAMVTVNHSAEFAAKSKAYVERNHSLNDLKIKEINDIFHSTLGVNKR